MVYCDSTTTTRSNHIWIYRIQGVRTVKKPEPFNPKICGANELYNRANKQILLKMHLGWKWNRIRRSYISQHPFCERCGLMGECVHHIIPRCKAPELTYEWSNLMTLCNDCHMKEHKMGNPNSYELGQSMEEREYVYDELERMRSKGTERDV